MSSNDLPPKTYYERLTDVMNLARHHNTLPKVYWREYSEELLVSICKDFGKPKHEVLQDYKDVLWNFFKPF